MSARILVTGATGFVGTTLCELLSQSGYRVRAALRSNRVTAPGIEAHVVGEIDSSTEWAAALEGVEYVIHAAARVHALNDVPSNADLYVETNTHGTRRLAAAAAGSGVRRFVFLSTIKVNGEERAGGGYGPADAPDPQDAYGRSKWQGEQAIREVAAGSQMEFAIVRPPLVYGPGVRANFLRLMRWIAQKRPLPFGAVRNRRSLVSVANLCDLVLRVIAHPAAANRVWMVSDGEDLSTPELIRRIARAMDCEPRLLSVPPSLLMALATLAGKRAEVGRLCGSLVVDIAGTRQKLAWEPRVSLDDAIARTVEWYLREAQLT